MCKPYQNWTAWNDKYKPYHDKEERRNVKCKPYQDRTARNDRSKPYQDQEEARND